MDYLQSTISIWGVKGGEETVTNFIKLCTNEIYRIHMYHINKIFILVGFLKNKSCKRINWTKWFVILFLQGESENLFTYFMVHSLHSLFYFHCTSKVRCTLFMLERLGHKERGGNIHKSNPQANYLIIRLGFQRL